MVRTAVLCLVFWAGMAAPAIAGDIGERFKADFGEDASIPRAAETNNPVGIVVPSPRLRPSLTSAHVPALSDDRALPSASVRIRRVVAPGSGATDPATDHANPHEAAISWNPLDTAWDGMFLSNQGEKPFALLGIELNGRRDCTVRPYSLDKLRRYVELPRAIKVWGQRAINLFGLPDMKPDTVLAPDLPVELQNASVQPEAPTLRTGGRVPIFNGTKCDPVTAATVETDLGQASIRFQRPYRGH